MIFFENGSDTTAPLGVVLGAWTDELLPQVGPGGFIDEFVTTGPKAYSYKAVSIDGSQTFEVCKAKGISLTAKNRQLINFESMKHVVMTPGKTIITFLESKIKRQKVSGIISRPETKIFKYTSDKRVRISDLHTIPYGYDKQANFPNSSSRK